VAGGQGRWSTHFRSRTWRDTVRRPGPSPISTGRTDLCTDCAGRGGGCPARPAAQGGDVRHRAHESAAASPPNVRAGRVRLGGANRARPPGVELRRVRRSHQRRDSLRAARLAALSRRCAGRRVARPDRSADRPRDTPGAGHRREHATASDTTCRGHGGSARACWSGPAMLRRWLLIATLSAIGVMVTHPIFFAGTNESFVRRPFGFSGAIPARSVGSLALNSYRTWDRWFHRGIASASAVCRRL
jgi:hypothetical protein